MEKMGGSNVATMHEDEVRASGGTPSPFVFCMDAHFHANPRHVQDLATCVGRVFDKPRMIGKHRHVIKSTRC